MHYLEMFLDLQENGKKYAEREKKERLGAELDRMTVERKRIFFKITRICQHDMLLFLTNHRNFCNITYTVWDNSVMRKEV